MRYKRRRDLKRRLKFLKIESKYIVYSVIKKNNFFPVSWRVYGAFQLRNDFGYCSKIHNFCIYTGRSRGVLRDYKISRHLFKLYSSEGAIYGIKKSSW